MFEFEFLEKFMYLLQFQIFITIYADFQHM